MSDLKSKIKHKNQKIIDGIVNIICNQSGLSKKQMESETRKREIVEPRQMAMFFSCYYTTASLAEVGYLVGKKDHATVLHAKRTVKNLFETNKFYRQRFEKLDLMVKNYVTRQNKQMQVCSICFEPDVIQQFWLDPNTGKILDPVTKNDSYIAYCHHCQAYTNLSTVNLINDANAVSHLETLPGSVQKSDS